MRLKRPSRTVGLGAYARYQLYKPHLRDDFFQRCGYCDDWDRFAGGLPGYHVDHFAPKKRFPDLQLSYTNFVYACPFCNRAKSDKWVGPDALTSHDGTQGFLDPCLEEFDNHISRDEVGRFVGETALGEYMVKHLRLFLERHRFIWAIQQLHELVLRAEVIRHRVDKEHEKYIPLLETLADLETQIRAYNDQLFGAAPA